MTVRHKLFCTTCSLLLVSLLSVQGAVANDSDPALVNIIKSIERGWETADGTPFRQHFLDFEGARYIDGDWKVVHTHSSSRLVKKD